MVPVQETFTEALEFTSEFTPRTWPNLTKHRDLPVSTVAKQLDIALPAPDGSRTVAASARVQARTRLGAEPMEWLFVRTSDEWAHRSADAHRWQGLALYAVDGTTLRVADSVDNREHFGGQDSGRHEGGRDERQSDYPLLRLVVVMAVRSHLIAAAVFGPYAVDERRYAESLWSNVPDDALVLIDRQYLQANVLVPLVKRQESPLDHAREGQHEVHDGTALGPRR